MPLTASGLSRLPSTVARFGRICISSRLDLVGFFHPSFRSFRGEHAASALRKFIHTLTVFVSKIRRLWSAIRSLKPRQSQRSYARVLNPGRVFTTGKLRNWSARAGSEENFLAFSGRSARFLYGHPFSAAPQVQLTEDSAIEMDGDAGRSCGRMTWYNFFQLNGFQGSRLKFF